MLAFINTYTGDEIVNKTTNENRIEGSIEKYKRSFFASFSEKPRGFNFSMIQKQHIMKEKINLIGKILRSHRK